MSAADRRSRKAHPAAEDAARRRLRGDGRRSPTHRLRSARPRRRQWMIDGDRAASPGSLRVRRRSGRSIAKFGGRIPDPVTVGTAAAKIFADPFYSKGPNDQGIGWNVLSSLKRVGIGFGLAALVGIPLGFMIGRFRFLSGMAAPIIALLKPVSPLAWLPIGLLVFKAANPAAI